MAPDADPGEEVALGVAPEVVGSNIANIPFVHVARRDVPGSDQVAQPLRGIRIVLVVVGAHCARPSRSAGERVVMGKSRAAKPTVARRSLCKSQGAPKAHCFPDPRANGESQGGTSNVGVA